jgi:hypothetical protein
LVEDLIDRPNKMEPNDDLEPSGDELDGTGAEGDFALLVGPGRLWGPGCEISDPGCC